MTRVMIVDDQPSIRLGLSSLLGTAGDLTLCATADCGETAVDLAAELDPDVVVMDLSMPGIGGLRAIERIRSVSPETQVLVLTWAADAPNVRHAFAAGATGYVLKGDSEIDLLDSIRLVAQRRRCVSAAVSTF